MKLRVSQLRRIIAEELQQARQPKRPLPTPADWARMAEEGKARSEATWMGYLDAYPKLLATIDREAFLEKLRDRQEGAAGGGWSIGKAEVVAAFLEELERNS